MSVWLEEGCRIFREIKEWEGRGEGPEDEWILKVEEGLKSEADEGGGREERGMRAVTRFDSFSGVELGCLVGSLACYGLSAAGASGICPMHGVAPSRDALVSEIEGSVNFSLGSYPDLSGINVGSSIS